MKKMIGAALALLCVGCGGGPKQEDLDKLSKDVEYKLKAQTTDTDGKIAKMEQKYGTVMQLEQKTTKAVGEIEKNSQLLAKATDYIIQILEAQQSALKDQLKVVEGMLKDLKK